VLGTTVASMHARYGSRLAAVYVYQAHDQQPTGVATDLESHFGTLQQNGEAKGAYTSTVQTLLSANP
jgi:hypothetical protein